MSLSSQKRKRSTPEGDMLTSGHDEFDGTSHLEPPEGHRTSKRPKKTSRPISTAANSAPPSNSSYLPIALGGFGSVPTRNRIIHPTAAILTASFTIALHGRNVQVEHLHRCIRGRETAVEVHNFAFPGATAEEDLSSQLAAFFNAFPVKGRDNPTPALDKDNTSYFVFIGINDCEANDSGDLESVVESLFDVLHRLYVQAGARNFVLFDVPPVDRSPQAIDLGAVEGVADRVETWNELLRAQATEFGTSSEEATVLLFSPHQVLTEVLDDPLEYDLGEDDPTTEGGGIWIDDLHLTSEVHDILGEQVFKSLFGL